MRKWWKQLWCLHFWYQNCATDAVYGKGIEYEYICMRCDKHIRSFNEPVSWHP